MFAAWTRCPEIDVAAEMAICLPEGFALTLTATRLSPGFVPAQHRLIPALTVALIYAVVTVQLFMGIMAGNRVIARRLAIVPYLAQAATRAWAIPAALAWAAVLMIILAVVVVHLVRETIVALLILS